MRPIQLTMTAFGPYKQREVIDFSDLGDHRIFAISGNTGAGKTTIFDAICYALYGEASGEERSDTSMLRSHFADDNVYTSVELTFQLKGKRYEIKRQLGHKKKGNKTVTGHAIELYEVVNGEKNPCVDRFHVTDVNKKVEELIGLSKHQFSQIVMLPQGEFRKLLTSETENKEEILRRIFKTDRYKLMRELLDQKRKQWKDVLQGKQKEREIYFRNTFQLPVRDGSLLEILVQQEHVNTHQVIEALEQEMSYYEAEIRQLQAQQIAQTKQLKEIEEHFHTAKSTNEKFQDLQRKKEQQQALEARREQIEIAEKHFKRAEQAKRLLPFEQWYEEAQQSEQNAQRSLNQITVQKEKTAEAFALAQRKYEELKQKEPAREELKQNVQRLEELQPVITSLVEQKSTMQKAEAQSERMKTNIQKFEQQLEVQISQKQQLTKELNHLEIALEQYVEKVEELTHMREDAKVLKQAYDVWEEKEKYEQEKKQATQNMEIAVTTYEEMESRWLNEQAGILALHLHDGESCPVCGSTTHPNKATERGDSIDENQLNELREKKNIAEKSYLQLAEKWNFYRQQYEQIIEEVKKRGYQPESLVDTYHALVQKGKQRAAEVNRLKESEEKRKQLALHVKELEVQLEEVQKEKREMEMTYHSIEKEYIELRTSYEYNQQKIPENLQTFEAWKQKLDSATQELRTMEDEWKKGQDAYQHWQNEYVRMQAEYDSAVKQVNNAREKREETFARFANELEQGGFPDQSAYKEAKRTDTEIAELQQKIKRYYSSLEVLAKQIEELTNELQDKEWMDIISIEEQMKKLDIELDITKEKRQRAQSAVEYISDLYENIRRIDEQIREEEKAFQELVDLYEVMKGDNESRISFERYILIEYLEQIVHIANERLRKLSNGQFYLKRSERVEKRNRQSGLGLDVYDAYTGQTRDVKTLSGGEKFNASLCLALAMSDVIQAYEGGISIETMFIDEGFGSLDEESLTKAVDALIDLQKSGRFIGVISHVQELKNAMPAVLEVTKQKDGCSQAKFMVK
ncbi:AAA family ATPase [Bacillus cytotoxicus]|uniref:Nuclease SbcCD subunit C n=1 Tax=Bacillus cytotoxicus (strain DSM 22905 / CIP 110041 / 391-98 / NVH 391-98) TaxID=315749 RepID=A7GPI0_BACCN|nr:MULTISPECIES: SMC family ATPase [Bacillus cereus group]ABS22038.1 SMC domain protein [Bacillus cytotoxicus NVH 391-98]AWC32662.1 SMC family ATPase [Bacillus cytotoxicus]AWC36690.1 SMC family ATPase [Bacillus cytotoxicus]AWC44719.1 SMC family ATPase [Bacillus cytotoxicus]AWC60947.1 SMC family ATPase [Bacillus cytotoxicus]